MQKMIRKFGEFLILRCLLSIFILTQIDAINYLDAHAIKCIQVSNFEIIEQSTQRFGMQLYQHINLFHERQLETNKDYYVKLSQIINIVKTFERSRVKLKVHEDACTTIFRKFETINNQINLKCYFTFEYLVGNDKSSALFFVTQELKAQYMRSTN